MSRPVTELKERLREALKIRNMKPIELSEKTGIPKAAISQYMSGYTKPKSDRIYSIAKALDVSEAWLMGYNVPMNNEREGIDWYHFSPKLFWQSNEGVKLIESFLSLNEDGKNELMKYMDYLLHQERYEGVSYIGKLHQDSLLPDKYYESNKKKTEADSKRTGVRRKPAFTMSNGNKFEVVKISDGVAVLKAVRTSADPNTQSLAKAIDNKIKTTLTSPDGKQIDMNTNLEHHNAFEGINIWAPSSTKNKTVKSLEKKQ